MRVLDDEKGVSMPVPITHLQIRILAHHLATVIALEHVDLDLVDVTDDLNVMRSLCTGIPSS